MKELSRGIRINILSNFLRFSRAGFFALAAYLYGLEAFGVYTVAWAAVEILIRFGYLGLDQGILFELAHFQRSNEEAKLYRKIVSCIKVAFPLALLESVALLAYTFWKVDTPAIRQALFLLIPLIPLYIVATLLLQATMALKEAKYSALIRGGVEPGSLLLFALLFWATPFRGVGILLAQAGALLVTSLVSLWAFGRFFSWKKVWEAMRWNIHFRSVIRYSLPMQLIGIFDVLFYRIDIYFITYFLGTGSLEQKRLLGAYGLAKQIARVIIQTQTAFAQIFAPVASESFLGKDIDSLFKQVRYSLRKLMWLNIPFVTILAVFGIDILHLLGKNIGAFPAAAYYWLLAGQFFYSSSFLLMVLLVTTHQATRFLIAGACLLVLAFGIGIFLVPAYQTVGAGLLTFLCYFGLSLAAVGEVWCRVFQQSSS